ncbi:MAG: single-stranded-DNA-specific exonuclease RecJ [Firmicutes bacterium]|nr:single-stranded-DNA-specific exonuclease RecJ [Bacillota bacterium]
MKQWLITKADKTKAAELAEENGFSPFLTLLLMARGYDTPEKISHFLQADEWDDPMLLKDMDKAAARILRALDSFERIVIYGDYDADGVTSTALLYSYLEQRGGNVGYFIPDREADGYGMNRGAVKRLAEEGARLIITVDNGISSADEVAYAAELGVDVVVTDHHTPPEILPQAAAVVNPHRPGCSSRFKNLCGVGVVLKLVSALEGAELDPEALFENFADYAAIGTVGDIVPLQGENRRIVREGLYQIANSEKPGIRALLEKTGLQGTLSTGNLSFTIVPRINAVGRMGSSDRSVRLLLSDYEEEALSLADEMEQENAERQKQEQLVLEQAMEQLHREPRRQLERVIVVWGEGWHPGVLGIVASRITEKFGKPSVVLSVNGAEAKGSCRSIAGFSIIRALTDCAPLLSRFGGHTLAAGLTLQTEKLEEFFSAVNRCAAQQCPQMPMPQISIDCKLKPEGLSVALAAELEQLEPFGAGNPTPVFALLQLELKEIRPVGGGKHLRLLFSRDGASVSAMLFRTTPQEFPFVPGDVLDLAVTLERSEYRGEEQLSVFIRDYRPAGQEAEILFAQKQNYEAFARGEDADKASMLPDRAQLAAVYRLLQREQNKPRTMEYLCSRLQNEKIGYDKLTIALIAMKQAGLLRMERDADTLTVSLCTTNGKVPLEQAPILQRLRAQ